MANKKPSTKAFPETAPTPQQQKFYDGDETRFGRDVVGTEYDKLVDADVAPDYASSYFSEGAMDPYEVQWCPSEISRMPSDSMKGPRVGP